ncbi:MaoC family dehydratase N-terminal domain-containing protein [Alcaligenaceae bacterium]|nr:MaoC family dehydratase N-terminal domain-containing protein [Alcaligenaceae bacterium]
MSDTMQLLKEGPVLFYEDFQVGDSYETSGRTITEADVVNFAGLSADYNALHVDAEFAGRTPHGGRIAHGLLVLAVASGLCTRLPVMKFLESSILGLKDLSCRFLKPCKIGDTIRVRLSIEEKTPGRRPGRGTIVMKRAAVNQKDEVVMDSTWRLVVLSRETETA